MLGLILLPVVVIALFCRIMWPKTISWSETAIQTGVVCFLIFSLYTLSMFGASYDVETINGKVTDKEKEWVSCSHSYSCNCRTVTSGSGKNKSTSTKCDTCYRHFNDWDWNVKTSVGNFTINRIDDRGYYEPPRWTAVQVNQPVAIPHGYTNYVKAAPDSLFHPIMDFKGKLPEYPGYFDYQYSNRVIGVPRDQKLWNDLLALSLNDRGATKQVNYVIVFTTESHRFADALKSKWLGGKKNDVLVIIGVKPYPIINWVDVTSWSKQDIVNISLRNALIDSKVLDPYKTIEIINSNVDRYYTRRPMEDFKYLENNVQPSMWLVVVVLIIGVISSISLAYYFHRN